MLIDIDLIHMDGRIRRDYGDIAELAEDIRKNGLINPPVVIPNADGSYTLLAGERRIRAMRQLGYRQVEIRTWRDLDAAARLEVEISENEQRKEFSPRERYEMFQRRYSFLKGRGSLPQSAAQTAPSSEGAKGNESPFRKGRATDYDQAAADTGISTKTIPQVREILAHEGELDPQMIADWDDRKLSTAKLYRELKARTAENDAAIAYQKGVISELERKLARGDGKGARADAELTKARNAAEEWKRAYEGLLQRVQERAKAGERPHPSAQSADTFPRGDTSSVSYADTFPKGEGRGYDGGLPSQSKPEVLTAPPMGEPRGYGGTTESGGAEGTVERPHPSATLTPSPEGKAEDATDAQVFDAMCERFVRAARGYARLAGTKYRGEYAEAVRTVMNWAAQAWNEMQNWRKE